MFKLISLFLFSLSAFALPPIEGGKDAPLSSFDYVDVIKLSFANQDECTATQVSATLILTAAHCVEDVSIGTRLSGVGKIVKVSPHPKYAEAKLSKKKEFATLYDIAFIEIEERPSSRTKPYPTIISAQTKFATRKSMEMAGFGMNEARWNGSRYEFTATKASLQIGSNKWEECPLDYFANEVEALDTFNKNLKQHLTIKAKRIHTIIAGQETVTKNGEGMVLPGDSGSPSIERDENKQLVLTGVASNVVTFQDGSGDAEFEIEVAGKIITTQRLSSMPNNWGQRDKSDVEFDEIKKSLQENGLVTDSGELKAGVVIKRQYTRISDGNYADLSHPENQKFIQSIMKKAP